MEQKRIYYKLRNLATKAEKKVARLSKICKRNINYELIVKP